MPFMTKIFVASSTSAKSQAKAFIKGCNAPDFTFLPWWDEFVAGKTLLEELTRIQKQVQKAVVILSPESDAKIRGHRQQIPNLNVLFEFGFFYGTLGKDNVAIVRYGQIYLPSDLDGYIHITGSSFFKRNAATMPSDWKWGKFKIVGSPKAPEGWRSPRRWRVHRWPASGAKRCRVQCPSTALGGTQMQAGITICGAKG